MNTHATASTSKNELGILDGGLLARVLDAACLIIVTDEAEVYLDWGQPNQRAGKATPQALAAYDFATGSMGPKVGAACAFVLTRAKPAVIRSLYYIGETLVGSAGSQGGLESAGHADTM